MANSVPARSASEAAASRHWRKRFLETLTATSDIARAAAAAKVSVTRAYQTRRTDPDFAKAWQAAIADTYLNLEMDVIRRLREGDLKTKDGDKFDFANAIRLIAAYRDNASRGGQPEVRNVSVAEVRASIDRKIDEIQRRVARQKAAQEKTA